MSKQILKVGLLTSLLLISLQVSGQNLSLMRKQMKVAALLRNMAYTDAISIAELVVDSLEQAPGPKNIYYVLWTGMLADMYQVNEQIKKARIYSERALAVADTLLEKTDFRYLDRVDNLAFLLMDLGDYRKADSLYNYVLATRVKLLGTDNEGYANTLYKQGRLYFTVGRYEEAKTLYEKALPIIKDKLGEKNSFYGKILTQLAFAYKTIGQPAKAEQLYLQALAIHKKNLDEKFSPSIDALNKSVYAEILDELAFLYQEMQQHERSGPLFQEALHLQKEASGERSANYMASLNSVGTYYVSVKNYPVAENYFKKALQLQKDVLGVDHADYAITLNSLGNLYLNRSDYLKADSIFQETVRSDVRLFGRNHLGTAIALNNLAITSARLKQYPKADSLFRQALQICRQQVGYNHIRYVSNLNSLIRLQVNLGNDLIADSLFRSSMEIEQTLSKQYNQFLSEYENDQTQKQFTNFFDFQASFYTTHRNRFPESLGALLNNSLHRKGNLLQNLELMRQRIASSGDTSLTHLFADWQNQKRLLAIYIQQPVEKRTVNLANEQEKADQFEKKLIRQSQAVQNIQALETIQWTDIRDSLKIGQAAIEFVRFTFSQVARQTDSIQYAAFIIRPGDKQPLLIPLFEEAKLSSLLRKAQNKRGGPGQLYAQRSSALLSGSAPVNGRQVYQLVWQPLMPYLDKVHTIYFSPSGLLHRIAFAALPIAPDSLLGNRFSLHQRFNLRSLVQPVSSVSPQQSWQVVAFGGIKYGDSSVEPSPKLIPQKIGATAGGLIAFQLGKKTSKRGNSLIDLPGTLKEIQALDSCLENRVREVKLFQGWEATEEAFKLTDRPASPAVIHLATHGFFFPPPQSHYVDQGARQTAGRTFSWQTAEDPLLRSGLLLARSGRVWQGQPAVEGEDDGVLTAYEIARMNLSESELVVLSACETGLGDVVGSEGVYGLQRAFKLAGTKRLIMSLWKVPDKETKEFMAEFYQQWQSGVSIDQAFRKAQTKLYRHYPKTPQKWAAFILVE